MSSRFLLLLFALFLAFSASAEVVYYEGAYAFDYEQWPWGGYDGSFFASGPMFDPETGWPDGHTESVGGSKMVYADTLVTYCVAAILNPDSTVNVAALFLRTDADNFEPGDYAIDVTDFMAGYAFFDRVSNFTVPEDPSDLGAWIDGIVADHKFFGTSGVVSLEEASDTALRGTFYGAMADPNDFTIISVTNGYFDLAGMVVSSAGDPAYARSHASYPNPFNPKTTIRFQMEEAGQARVAIYDIRGRELRVLLNEVCEAGENRVDWDGRNRSGEGQAAGLYFYRITSGGEQRSGKMVLLP
ncbi:MAG: T9SS type A sorting domain-containing protein [Candidatus Krumholzibacteria bacterium]|jgi:hypothetical protein|nr:T9SS type A sorting domain-containing protein [Candidatus Krumholzibacteria bacterium]MDP6668483.1 T9SS type A sorting domain-containing protein [Candidatus Krumholzibacteria bacterium]MDP6797377.1 T9SS type A sorting domain-containing protein [Candidatus Krumholzibacteria bacterium]MDP7021576.1 T9SS type A sorting domain-containing protein [Candidatus Krumholzibacteria bacterium]